VALNYLGHLSGIASKTAHLVDLVAHTKAQICDTRKTTPGLRAVEKYAVRAGGGANHRFGLDDAIMIKDNHIAVAGGITPALKAAQSGAGHMVAIEIEVDTLAQLDEALAADARIILLDNMTPEQLAEAVARTQGRAILEASGRVSETTVVAIAESGVDYISVGAITHSAATLDLGLDIDIS
jgi:nicotinate-nucleotide pyrophosphorylase (carboxylating)